MVLSQCVDKTSYGSVFSFTILCSSFLVFLFIDLLLILVTISSEAFLLAFDTVMLLVEHQKAGHCRKKFNMG